MNIYIAGPWKAKEEAKALAAFLSLRGHTITHNWWDWDVPDSDPLELRKCAVSDILGVLRSELLLVVDTKVSEGKATEQGMALSTGIPVVVLHKAGEEGKPFHNVFHYLPSVTHVYGINQLVEVLDNGIRDEGQREEDFVHKWDGEGHLGG